MWWRTNASSSSHGEPKSTGLGANTLPQRSLPPGRNHAAERRLERRIRRLLRTLDVRTPFSVEALCRALSESRGRHIELRPYPLPTPGPVGLWFETRSVDLIIFQRDTTPLHQDHIILHEVGHILADHGAADAGAQWEVLLPGLKPDAIRRVLQRCSYESEQEQEAELIATIIMEWASVVDRVVQPEHDPSARRIGNALGDRQGWL